MAFVIFSYTAEDLLPSDGSLRSGLGPPTTVLRNAPQTHSTDYLIKASSQLGFLILEKAGFYQADEISPGQVVTVERMWF